MMESEIINEMLDRVKDAPSATNKIVNYLISKLNKYEIYPVEHSIYWDADRHRVSTDIFLHFKYTPENWELVKLVEEEILENLFAEYYYCQDHDTWTWQGYEWQPPTVRAWYKEDEKVIFLSIDQDVDYDR